MMKRLYARLVEDHPATLGFVIAAAIMVVVFYAVSFGARDDSVTNCQQRNEQMREVNERRAVINTLVKLERTEVEEGEHTRAEVARLHRVAHVHLTDCEETFERPWPFG